MRDQLNQDTQVLASLNPDSTTYRRLAARVEQQTARLLDYEDQRERRLQVARQAMIEQHRRDQESSMQGAGFFCLVLGGIITYAGWGTWWLVLGIVFVLAGLVALINKDA